MRRNGRRVGNRAVAAAAAATGRTMAGKEEGWIEAVAGESAWTTAATVDGSRRRRRMMMEEVMGGGGGR